VQEIEFNCLVLGVLAALMGVALHWRRRRLVMVLAVVFAMSIFGLMKGVVFPSDALELLADLDLSDAVIRLVLWAGFGVAVRSAGRAWLPGPPIVVATLTGALLGELGGAAVLSAAARDRSAAARLALAAAGGGMIGRFGDPAMLLLWDRMDGGLWVLAPIGLLCVVVARPNATDLIPEEESDPVVTLIGALTAASVFVPSFGNMGVGLGTIALLWVGRSRLRGLPLWPVGWALATVPVVCILAAAGLPELAAGALEQAQYDLNDTTLTVLAAGGALASALLDGTGGSLLAAAFADRALSMSVDGWLPALAAGTAVGGLGPLIVADALGPGLFRWMLQVAVVVAVVDLVLV